VFRVQAGEKGIYPVSRAESISCSAGR